MADEIDIANDKAQDDLDRRIEAARGVINHEATVEDSADNCTECDTEIPEKRRIAIPGCSLCIDCQSISEREL